MKISPRFFLLGLLSLLPAVSPSLGAEGSSSLAKLRETLAQGDYADALKQAKEIGGKSGTSPEREEALYLQAYLQACRGEFQAAQSPLQSLLKDYRRGRYAREAQELLADCLYWGGSYEKAVEEYDRMAEESTGKRLGAYAQIQKAHCLVLSGKAGDALSAYREVIEKYPGDPFADSAQLMIANTYLKLQNKALATVELQKFIASSRNPELSAKAQQGLQRLQEDSKKKASPQKAKKKKTQSR